MKKLLVTLIAATFVSAAVAQGATDPPMTNKQKQEALRSSTISGSDRRPAVEKQQEANVKASKATEKMTTDEKNKALKDVNTKMVNPNNAGGVEATAKMQKETTAASKEQAKQKVNLGTPEAQKAMQKAATP
jgi:Ni/Co efflux regulator RcnB